MGLGHMCVIIAVFIAGQKLDSIGCRIKTGGPIIIPDGIEIGPLRNFNSGLAGYQWEIGSSTK